MFENLYENPNLSWDFSDLTDWLNESIIDSYGLKKFVDKKALNGAKIGLKAQKSQIIGGLS